MNVVSVVRTYAVRCALALTTLLLACGDESASQPADAPATQPDVATTCQPQSVTGAFYRRAPNPRMVAGTKTFTDGKLDTSFVAPDLRWDDSSQRWVVFYESPHGTFSSPGTPIIRRASSSDLSSWAIDDLPTLQVGAAQGWDGAAIGAPSVAYNPDASPDRRYIMLYSGAAGVFPFPGYSFPESSIGVAFSADGITFTRVSAGDSPKGKAGLVLTGADAYPDSTGAIVTDPEVAFVSGTYHAWFSSFACSGTDCATATAKGIGHATSTDGVHWSVEAAPVLSLLRQSSMPTSGGTHPTVTYDDVHCRWELWLANDSDADVSTQPVNMNNTAGPRYATSSNAMSWTLNYGAARDVVWDSTAGGEHLGLRDGLDVARKSTGRYMLYVGFDDQKVPAGSTLPSRSNPSSTIPGVMTLNLAARDAPP